MRGGKRANSGRKSVGKTKVYRLPVALEPLIKKALAEYKSSFSDSPKVRSIQSNSKFIYPVLPMDLKRILRKCLIKNFGLSADDAKVAVATPRDCYSFYCQVCSRLSVQYQDGLLSSFSPLHDFYSSCALHSEPVNSD